jgi:hypothetical protein
MTPLPLPIKTIVLKWLTLYNVVTYVVTSLSISNVWKSPSTYIPDLVYYTSFLSNSSAGSGT